MAKKQGTLALGAVSFVALLCIIIGVVWAVAEAHNGLLCVLCGIGLAIWVELRKA